MNRSVWLTWQTALLIAIGVFCGIMTMSYLQTKFVPEKVTGKEQLALAMRLGFCILGATILLELRKRVHGIIEHLSLTEGTRQHFFKNHAYTYLIFFGYAATYSGIKANLAFFLFIMTLFVIAQCILLWRSADAAQKERWCVSADAIPALFFLSGFAALIYQVVWQRVLFATFGSNIESVTVIVSVFMFGLGIGALAGGQIQKRYPHRFLGCFIAIEIAIGVFGIFSIPLIHMIGSIAPQQTLPALIATTYALLAFPTMLMGSTLPILVSYLEKRYSTVSATVGKLYAYNTFGSALASFLTVMLVFTLMGQQATLVLAALCNLATAYWVWRLFQRSAATQETYGERITTYPPQAFSYRVALFLSLAIGFLSLSLEIIWIRVLGYMSANMPQVFGTLLAIFLVGIACGSLKAKRWSEEGGDSRIFIQRSLAWMALIAYFSVPVAAYLASYAGKAFGAIAGYAATGLLAYFAGGIFPLLCQTGSSKSDTGVAVSYIYFFNIIGATLGSLITGFILFDAFSLAQNMGIISAAIVLLLLVLRPTLPKRYAFGSIALVIVGISLYPVLFKGVISKLGGFIPEATAKYVNENRHGIITVMKSQPHDIIYGNGIYDGRFNIDPVLNSNMITRAYMVAALHPNPKRILEIGLSSGSWAKVFSMYEPLESLTSIEINPGYLDVMRHYPEIHSLTKNPKWSYYIDDGRRWLKNHPDEKFDAIVMNTTFYWRMNSTNVLSKEFLEICKKYLKPGGIVFYNTTESRDVIYTAASVFKHVTLVVNFVAASDTPFNLSAEQKKQNLLSFLDDNGHPVFANPDPAYSALLEKLVHKPLPELRDLILKEVRWLITDDNMASEFKTDSAFQPPQQ